MQQVNLLHALPQKTNLWLSAKMGYLVCFVLMVSLLIIVGGVQLQSWHYSNQLSMLMQQKNKAENIFEMNVHKYPLMVDSHALPAKIAALQQQLMTRDKSWREITSSALTRGFSQYMQGLAQYVPAGIWLDSIYINNHGSTIALTGNSLKPAMVPLMMNKLTQHPSFKNNVFKVLQLFENKKNHTITFLVGTAVTQATEDANSVTSSVGTAQKTMGSVQEKL